MKHRLTRKEFDKSLACAADGRGGSQTSMWRVHDEKDDMTTLLHVDEHTRTHVRRYDADEHDTQVEEEMSIMSRLHTRVPSEGTMHYHSIHPPITPTSTRTHRLFSTHTSVMELPHSTHYDMQSSNMYSPTHAEYGGRVEKGAGGEGRGVDRDTHIDRIHGPSGSPSLLPHTLHNKSPHHSHMLLASAILLDTIPLYATTPLHRGHSFVDVPLHTLSSNDMEVHMHTRVNGTSESVSDMR